MHTIWSYAYMHVPFAICICVSPDAYTTQNRPWTERERGGEIDDFTHSCVHFEPKKKHQVELLMMRGMRMEQRLSSGEREGGDCSFDEEGLHSSEWKEERELQVTP